MFVLTVTTGGYGVELGISFVIVLKCRPERATIRSPDLSKALTKIFRVRVQLCELSHRGKNGAAQVPHCHDIAATRTVQYLDPLAAPAAGPRRCFDRLNPPF
jgi:hypothetical protein